jgi:hypothetical protein
MTKTKGDRIGRPFILTANHTQSYLPRKPARKLNTEIQQQEYLTTLNTNEHENKEMLTMKKRKYYKKL